MVVPPTALDKLRKELRRRRQAVAKECVFMSHARFDAVLSGARSVGLYRSIGMEPDPLPLLGMFGGVSCLPAISADSSMMTFRSWFPGDPLVPASWGGQQPAATAAVTAPDLILVPVLGFDGEFNRIGQGGGHYDRYLAAYPQACRIGIAWEVQRVDRIDPRPWDVPMDAILTEADFHVKDLTRCLHH